MTAADLLDLSPRTVVRVAAEAAESGPARREDEDYDPTEPAGGFRVGAPLGRTYPREEPTDVTAR